VKLTNDRYPGNVGRDGAAP